MFGMDERTTRLSLGTLAAFVVVALAGLALDRGHHGALPPGVVEVGEMTSYTM